MTATSLRTRRKEQTRLEIMQAAYALFLEQGTEEVSVEAICERAGVSRATFFNYYPQKEMILSDVFRLRVARVREFLDERSAREHKDISDVIEILLLFGAENEKLKPKARQILMTMWLNKGCQEQMRDVRQELVDTLAHFIDKLRRAGKLKTTAKSIDIAETMFSIYVGCTMEWMVMTDQKANSLVRSMRSRLQMLVNGFVSQSEV